MSEQSKRYRAFVSYSQKDKPQARRLHQALERYRLPKGVDAAGVDTKTRKLGRFFRDDEEMGAATDLGAALQGAIADAESLIVVCSPHAAQSRWVNEEIIHFKRTGRADNVFAVIVAGAPHSGDEHECFPPALRFALDEDGALTGQQAEPLAVDLRKESFARVLTRLAAGLAQIPFDTLWKREQRRAVAQAATLSLALFFVAVLIGGALTQSIWYPKVDAYWRYARQAHPAEDLLAAAPGATFQDCREGSPDCPVMVVIPEGTFLMGDAPPQRGWDEQARPQFEPEQRRRMSIRRFAVSQHEITFADWQACVAARGCKGYQPDREGREGDDLPVVNVNWGDAQGYVTWLSAATGYEYRLLSEAEWEYAASGVTSADDPRSNAPAGCVRSEWIYARDRGIDPPANCGLIGEVWSFGNDQAQLGDYAWFGSNSDEQAHPVGTKRANPFGLYDMYGNVAEWVQDCWVEPYDPSRLDGSAVDAPCSALPRPNGNRVLRGGSWYDGASRVGTSVRSNVYPSFRQGQIGFRVARTLARHTTVSQSAPRAEQAPRPPEISTSTPPAVVAERAPPTPSPSEATDTASGVSSESQARITSPVWLERPTLEEIRQHYPAAAVEAGVSARMRLDCLVNADGSLSCSVESIEATDYVAEFGEAALSLSRLYKMAPATADGTPTAGRHYRMPIAMRMD